jgi:hypothetical protein
MDAEYLASLLLLALIIPITFGEEYKTVGILTMYSFYKAFIIRPPNVSNINHLQISGPTE